MKILNFHKMKTYDPYSMGAGTVKIATKEECKAETEKRNKLSKKLTGKVQRLFYNGTVCNGAKVKAVENPRGTYAVGSTITR